MVKKRILSGMRPTGKLHIGHILGALKNWVRLQDEYQCYYMVADLHALTSEYEDTSKMQENIREMVIDWLACGIDPAKSTLLVQSRIPEHSELHLILSMITPVSWLERCPTYKEQMHEIKGKDLSTYGFLGYPVLQAADITLYKASVVPIGEDQLPHLELTREIVRRFDQFFGNVLPEPQALLTDVPRLLGTDGRKMSKSYNNAIYIADTQDEIKRKIMAMVTDPQRLRPTDVGHPDICSVYSYHKIFSPGQLAEIKEKCVTGKRGCVECKKILLENVLKFLSPVQEKRKMFEQDLPYIDKVLHEGTEKAREFARATMEEVKKAVRLK
ncbi:MAG: tryptophan--tRNA ligase [bacterium]|jgi:tryptophanyl-tRNA synthetase|nr:tryptophan--tRNA ligase [bacterium]